MILIILMMVLVVDDYVSDLANINFATVHSIQSFDLLVTTSTKAMVESLEPVVYSILPIPCYGQECNHLFR